MLGDLAFCEGDRCGVVVARQVQVADDDLAGLLVDLVGLDLAWTCLDREAVAVGIGCDLARDCAARVEDLGFAGCHVGEHDQLVRACCGVPERAFCILHVDASACGDGVVGVAHVVEREVVEVVENERCLVGRHVEGGRRGERCCACRCHASQRCGQTDSQGTGQRDLRCTTPLGCGCKHGGSS